MATRSRISSSHTYTMRELNQNTAKVIQEINEAGEPALITRQGRVVALITPLANERVEAAVLGAVLDEATNIRQLVGERTLESVEESGDVAEKADITYRGGYA